MKYVQAKEKQSYFELRSHWQNVCMILFVLKTQSLPKITAICLHHRSVLSSAIEIDELKLFWTSLCQKFYQRVDSQMPEIRKYKKKFTSDINSASLWGVNLLIGTKGEFLMLLHFLLYFFIFQGNVISSFVSLSFEINFQLAESIELFYWSVLYSIFNFFVRFYRYSRIKFTLSKNGLMLLDRQGQGKVYMLVPSRNFQKIEVVSLLHL